MKTALLVAFVALTVVSVPAQSEPPKNFENNLYALALKTSILQMEKDWGHIDDSGRSEEIRTDYRHMIVEKDSLITDGLPAEFENHAVEYLDHEGLVARCRIWASRTQLLQFAPSRTKAPR